MSKVGPSGVGSSYVLGEPPIQQKDHAAFEFKAHATGNTGGGYPRWRSYEFRPQTPGTEKEDVYVPVHRLCAVAWFFEGWTAEEVLRSEELVGVDVHHELGMPAANLEAELSLLDHGRHAEITQSQRRAWAEDEKQRVEEEQQQAVLLEESECEGCGSEIETKCVSDGFDGIRCVECAKADAGNHPIEVK